MIHRFIARHLQTAVNCHFMRFFETTSHRITSYRRHSQLYPGLSNRHSPHQIILRFASTKPSFFLNTLTKTAVNPQSFHWHQDLFIRSRRFYSQIFFLPTSSLPRHCQLWWEPHTYALFCHRMATPPNYDAPLQKNTTCPTSVHA